MKAATKKNNHPVRVPVPESFVFTILDPLIEGMLCALTGDYINMNTGESPLMFDYYRIPGGLFMAPESWRHRMQEDVMVRSLNHYVCKTTRRVAAALGQMTAMSRILIDYPNQPKANQAFGALMRYAYGKQWLTEDERRDLSRLAD